MKLKKVLITTLFSALLLISGLAQAASLSSLQIYKNNLPAPTSASKALKSSAYASQIDVLNNSSETIFVSVPGTPFSMRQLWPGEKYYFVSDEYFDFVFVKVFDAAGNLFFNDYVANRTTLIINDFEAASRKSAETKSKLKATISH